LRALEDRTLNTKDAKQINGCLERKDFAMGWKLTKAKSWMVLNAALPARPAMIPPKVHSAEARRMFRVLRGLLFVVTAVCISGGLHVAQAEILCADDLVPQGMTVTATGTAATCAGACRARQVEPVCGPVMKICAGQPIPKGYVLDSITTMPACQCLGQENDAYVIRYVGLKGKLRLSGGEGLRPPYGNPPFGNVLCATNSTGPQAYGNFSAPVQPYGNLPAWGGYGGYSPGSFPPSGAVSNRPGLSNGAPELWAPSPLQWNYQENEPFRVGQ
jgi:hypothetical protein